MRFIVHYKKWWHRFVPKYRREKEATEQIANFVLKTYEKQMEEKAIKYVSDRLVHGRTK